MQRYRPESRGAIAVSGPFSQLHQPLDDILVPDPDAQAGLLGGPVLCSASEPLVDHAVGHDGQYRAGTVWVEGRHGRMMATMPAGIAQFERDLISERVKSGLAAAKARGKKLGRQPGHRPKPDKLAPRVLEAVNEGRNYRRIARDLGIFRNTVAAIVRRHREGA